MGFQGGRRGLRDQRVQSESQGSESEDIDRRRSRETNLEIFFRICRSRIPDRPWIAVSLSTAEGLLAILH